MLAPTPITRAQFVRLACAACALGAVRPAGTFASKAQADETGAPDPFAFSDYQVNLMVAADPHYLSPRLTDHGAFFEALIGASDGKVMRYSDELAEAFVATAVAEQPDVLVIAGDLTYNGARESHQDFAAKLARIKEAGVAVLVLPGNHDIDCPQAARFQGDSYELVESISAGEFAQIYAAFGYDGALARDGASLSYVWECTPEVRFLFVDVNGVAELGAVPASTLAWIESQLADAAAVGARVVSFTHQSVLQQTFVSETYVISNAAELLELYGRYNVTANFCGHLHVQHHSFEGSLVEMATSALCVSPNQFARVRLGVVTDFATATVAQVDETAADGLAPGFGRVVPAEPKALLCLDYRTVPMGGRVAAWAAQQGLDDPNLLGFETYALEFFRGGDNARNAMILELALSGFGEAVEMVDFMLDTNVAYFSGRLDLMEPRPALVERWLEANMVIGYYLMYAYQIAPVRNENIVEVPLL